MGEVFSNVPFPPPTWERQIEEARRLYAEKGLAELYRYALVSIRYCKCNDCACCAAKHVYYTVARRERE